MSPARKHHIRTGYICRVVGAAFGRFYEYPDLSFYSYIQLLTCPIPVTPCHVATLPMPCASTVGGFSCLANVEARFVAEYRPLSQLPMVE